MPMQLDPKTSDACSLRVKICRNFSQYYWAYLHKGAMVVLQVTELSNRSKVDIGHDRSLDTAVQPLAHVKDPAVGSVEPRKLTAPEPQSSGVSELCSHRTPERRQGGDLVERASGSR